MTSGYPGLEGSTEPLLQGDSPQPIASTDRHAVLVLNNAHAAQLSWLEPSELDALLATAFHARRIGMLDAFLVAFDQDADYRSPNFLWFRDRYARFVYIDRVVVAAEARGRGLARKLYADLFHVARRAGHTLLTCEVNLDPPNPGSDAFHAALGFDVVGQESVAGASKSVRYYVRAI